MALNPIYRNPSCCKNRKFGFKPKNSLIYNKNVKKTKIAFKPNLESLNYEKAIFS
jgi:hypothetical protein|tara:strand:+ start:177 stop:341 length:165 start_codon:yes stop_codon:yes gene_type:complete